MKGVCVCGRLLRTDDLLLVTAQLLRVPLCAKQVWLARCSFIAFHHGREYLQGNKYGMCLADQPHGDGALFYSLESIFDLEDTALWGAIVKVVSGGGGFILSTNHVERGDMDGNYKVTESLS